MRLTDAEVAARLAAAPEHDVCVLRIEDGDFGCEEHREPAPLWLLCQTADGQKLSLNLKNQPWKVPLLIFYTSFSK